MLNKKLSNSSLTQYSNNQSIQDRLIVFDNRMKDELPLTIEDLTTLLDANWDFSFKYKNKIYEIIHDNNKIFLYKNVKPINKNQSYQTFLSTEDLLKNAKILNKPFIEIWTQSQYI